MQMRVCNQTEFYFPVLAFFLINVLRFHQNQGSAHSSVKVRNQCAKNRPTRSSLPLLPALIGRYARVFTVKSSARQAFIRQGRP